MTAHTNFMIIFYVFGAKVQSTRNQ